MNTQKGTKKTMIIIMVVVTALALVAATVVCSLSLNEKAGKVTILTTPVDRIADLDGNVVPFAGGTAAVSKEAVSGEVNQLVDFTATTSFDKYSDATITVAEAAYTKKPGMALVGVYAVYTGGELAGKAIGLQYAGRDGNDMAQWKLEGICGDCYLIAEWQQNTYTINWDAAGWTVPDKKDNAIVGVGISLEDMPLPTKSGAIFSHWWCTGNKVGGGTYATTYIPAEATSATCTPVTTIATSTTISDGALSTTLDNNDTQRWAGYFDIAGVDCFTSNGKDNRAGAEEAMRSFGSLTEYHRGLTSDNNVFNEIKSNARGIFFDGRLDKHRLGTYMTRSIALTQTQKDLLKNGYTLLVQASGKFTVGILSQGGDNPKSFLMADISIKEGASDTDTNSYNRYWNADLAAYGNENNKLSYPEGRIATNSTNSQGQTDATKATTKTLEITDQSVTDFQIQLEFIMYQAGWGSSNGKWSRLYGYVEDISYTVIPVKRNDYKSVNEVTLSSATRHGASVGYYSNYKGTGKKGIAWDNDNKTTYREIHGYGYIPISFSNDEKEAIKKNLNNGKDVYVTVTATFSVGQQKTTGDSSKKGYTYTWFSAWDGVETTAPDRSEWASDTKTNPEPLEMALNPTYSPMSALSSIFRYPAAHSDWGGNSNFEWSTTTMTTKRIPLTLNGNDVTAGVTAGWEYSFFQDNNINMTHCLMVEQLSYTIIYCGGGAYHKYNEAVYITDTSKNQSTNKTIYIASEQQDAADKEGSFTHSLANRASTVNTAYKEGNQNTDSKNRALGRSGVGMSWGFGTAFTAWYGYSYYTFNISNTNVINAIDDGKIALITAYSTYYACIQPNGSDTSNVFGYTGAELSAWEGGTDTYSYKETYRTPNGVIMTSLCRDGWTESSPGYQSAGGTFTTKEIPITKVTGNTIDITLGWKWTGWNSSNGNGACHAGLIVNMGYKIRLVDKFTGDYANGYTYTVNSGDGSDNEKSINSGSSGSIYTTTKLWKAGATVFAYNCPWVRTGYRLTGMQSSYQGAAYTYTAQWEKKKYPIISQDVFKDENNNSGTEYREEWYYEYGASIDVNTGAVPGNPAASTLYVNGGNPGHHSGFAYNSYSDLSDYVTVTYPEVAVPIGASNYGSTYIDVYGDITRQSQTPPKVRAQSNVWLDNSDRTSSYCYRSGWIGGDYWRNFDNTLATNGDNSASQTWGAGISYFASQSKAGTGTNIWNGYTYLTVQITNQEILDEISAGAIVTVTAVSDVLIGNYCAGDNNRSEGDSYAYFSVWSGNTHVYNSAAQSTRDVHTYSHEQAPFVLSTNGNGLSTGAAVLTDPNGYFTLGWNWKFINTNDSIDCPHAHFGIVTDGIKYVVKVEHSKSRRYEVNWDMDKPTLSFSGLDEVYAKQDFSLKDQTEANHGAADATIEYYWKRLTPAAAADANYMLSTGSTGKTVRNVADSGDYSVYVKATVIKGGTSLSTTGTAKSGTVTIRKRALNVQLTRKAEKQYGNPDPAEYDWTTDSVEQPAGGGLAGDDQQSVVTMSDFRRVEEGENHGGHAITATGTAANYEITVLNGLLTIRKRNVTVNVANCEKFYGEDDPAFTCTIASGSIVNLNGETKDTVVKLERTDNSNNVGTYTIAASSQDPNDNYNISGSGTLTIKKRPLRIIIDDKTQVYGDDPTELTWTLAGNNSEPSLENKFVYDDDKDDAGVINVTLARSDAGNNKVGDYYIGKSTCTSPNYDPSFVQGIYHITKRPIELTINDESVVYGEPEKTNFGWTITSGSMAYDENANTTFTLTYTKVSGVNVNVEGYRISGTCAETESTNNYNIKIVPGTYYITKRPVTVKIANATKVYGEDNPQFNINITYGSLVKPDTLAKAVSVTYSISSEAAGSQTITGVATSANYDVTVNSGTITISQRPIRVLLASQEKTYGDADPEYTWTIDTVIDNLNKGLVTGDDVSVLNITATRADKDTPNGEKGNNSTHIITGTGTADNYSVTVRANSLTIKKKDVTYSITVSGLLGNAEDGYYVYYGATVSSAVAGPTPVLLDKDAGQITVSAKYSSTVKNAGNYTVSADIQYGTVGGVDLSNNYNVIADINVTEFTIRKKPVSIILDPAGTMTKVYGDLDPSTFPWALAAGSTLEYDENPADTSVININGIKRLEAGQNVNANGYLFTAQNISSDNYDITEASITPARLVVTPKPVTVTIAHGGNQTFTKVYGDDDPAFTWSYTDLAEGESPEVLGFSVTRESGDDVKAGGYALTGSATNPNYAVTVADGSILNITPLALTFTVVNGAISKGLYTADDLPDPDDPNVGAGVSTTMLLPYDDIMTVTYSYSVAKSVIVAADVNAEGYDYISVAISIMHENGSEGDALANYTYDPVTVKLIVNTGNMFIDMTSINESYDFAENGGSGITLSIQNVKVKKNNISGEVISDAALSASVTSLDGSTVYFNDNGEGGIVILYVPSVNQATTSITLKIRFTAVCEGYRDRQASQNFVLNKEVLNMSGITFADAALQYDGLAKTVTYGGTLPSCLTAEVSYSDDDRTNVTAKGATATLNFALIGHEIGGRRYYSHVLPSSMTAHITVTQAPVTVTAKAQSAIYDGTVPTITSAGANYEVSGNVYGDDDLGVTLTLVSPLAAVGEYDITVSISNSNYALTAVNGKFTVQAREITIYLNYSGKTYGYAEPDWSDVTAALTVQNLVNGESVSDAVASIARAIGEEFGTYAVTVTPVTGSNYTISNDYSRFTFNIARRTIVVGFVGDMLTKTYDGNAVTALSANDALTLVDGTTLASRDSGKSFTELGFAITLSGGEIKNATTYDNAVTATASSVNNYDVRWENSSAVRSYVVLKRNVNIVIASKSAVYGATEPLTFEVVATQPEGYGLVGTEDADTMSVTLTHAGGAQPDVGEYAITATTSASSNYTVIATGEQAKYTVTALPVTVNIDDINITYGNNVPTLTWKLGEGESLAYGQSESTLRVNLRVTGGLGDKAGTYTITGTSANANYNVTINNGTLTVDKATPVINVSGVKVNYVYTGESFRIRSGARHNNTDLYATENLVYPDKEFLSVTDSGEYTITLAATDNFYGASATIDVVIQKATIVFDWSEVATDFSYTGELQAVTGVKINIDDGTVVQYSNNTFVDIPESGYLDVTAFVTQTVNFDATSETRRIYLTRYDVDMSGVSFDDIEVLFDGLEHTLVITGELPAGVTNVTYSDNSLLHVGSITVVAHFTVAGNYNPVEDLVAMLTINAREVNVDITGAQIVYGEEIAQPYVWSLGAEQPTPEVGDVVARAPLDITLSRRSGDNVGEYEYSMSGVNDDYILNLNLVSTFKISPRAISVEVDGAFSADYDGLPKTVTVADYVTLTGGTLAPQHANLVESGAVRVIVNKGSTMREARAYTGAIAFVIGNPNYAVTFNGTEDNSVTYDYVIKPRTITVSLSDQEVLNDAEINHFAYTIVYGALVSGDRLQLIISRGELDESTGKYLLKARSGNSNYVVVVKGKAYLKYAVRAVISVYMPDDFVYNGKVFSLQASINNSSALVFRINGEIGKNEFIEPGHYEVEITGAADDKLREPLPVVVTFNIDPIQIKLEDGDTDITITSDKGFRYEYPLEIKHEQGRTEDSEIVDKIGSEFTIIDGYVFRIGPEEDRIYVGEYLKKTNAANATLRVKVPSAYADSKTVDCVVIRNGESKRVSLTVDNGYIEINADGIEAIAFVTERQTLIALIIIVSGIGIVGIFMALYYIFRRKSY